MKAVIFDSGALISLSMNSLLPLLLDLKKSFDGKFLITREVEYEIVKRPMDIKKYKLEAMMIKRLIDDKILEFPESLNINSKDVSNSTQDFLKSSNSLFFSKDRPIHLIDLGESSCLALSKILLTKGMKNVIVIDERTTRVLGERPENVQRLMESKLHEKLFKKGVEDSAFKNMVFIRSAELIYVAYKKGLIKSADKNLLDAMLYGVKFKGCAISSDEIREIEKLA